MEDLQREMDEAGVSRAILCAPYFYPQGNDEYRAVVRANPGRFANNGYFTSVVRLVVP